MTSKSIICVIVSAIFSISVSAQSRIVKDFKPVCDSLSVLIQEKTSVKGALKLKAVMKRGTTLDLYFTRSLSDYPWHDDTYSWFENTLKSLFPDEYKSYKLGEIYSDKIRMDRLRTVYVGSDGQPAQTKYRIKDTRDADIPLVCNPDVPYYQNGLSGRHLAIWQSHGRFYQQSAGRWQWQRPCLFQTVEDMFTPGFVLPFLVPMIENAGGYVFLPRERDTQRAEIITDNDEHFTPDSESDPHIRTFGTYSESGKWESAGEGFADIMQVYDGEQNPFKSGTARQADCIATGRTPSKICTATWRPDIPKRGEYAVYVSYKSLPQSTESAHYTVSHLGGESHFLINQTMGGGTWIYLGTFEFAEGTEGKVTLDNITPPSRKHRTGSVVTADAVKIGGGMGNISRKVKDGPESIAETSGMPRYAEGARYWMQWSGCDTSVYSQNEGKNDYRDDFMSRGKWVQELSGGSKFNTKEKGRGIPVDMAFAFHSDAGVTPDDSIIGTLGIYTLLCEKSEKFPDGSSRMSSRELTDLIQSQIVNDVRTAYDPEWSRRHIWDRSYSESRTTGVPTMLLEMLSHQNFADMKHGLDPAFRFSVSRAVYKGILKYLSNRYGCPYVVQPLPVESFSARIVKDNDKYKTRLSWRAKADTLEPTAVAENFILYTRKDNGAFDNGKIIDKISWSDGYASAETEIQAGHIYSYKIVACNSGGKSFPSEILSVGIPQSYDSSSPLDSCIVIVNNFDRVSGPTWFDTPQFAGFDNRTDSGVPYMSDISFVGEMYQTRRDMPWISDDNPGFGASYRNFEGKEIAGNTFDYPFIHGKAIMEAGYPFYSTSAMAFSRDSVLRNEAWSADIICGKQVTTSVGRGAVADRFRVFPEEMQEAIKSFTANGGNILISGANIGTDIWDKVFPIQNDSLFRVKSIAFAEKVLGYKWSSNYASRTAHIKTKVSLKSGFKCQGLENGFSFNNKPCSKIYSVETPDGLLPANKKAESVFKYSDSGISAGICYNAGTYRTVCLGFPIETIEEESALKAIIISTIKFFSL